jgi:hypothetical protein
MMLILFALVLGCSDKGDDSASPESDADTDADSDTDTDADTDTDSDTDSTAPSDPTNPFANCESLEHDDWQDGRDDNEYLFRFDENGNQTYYRIDSDVDHDWDLIATYEYDTSENLTARRIDDGGDGDVDAETVYTYDAMNNQLTRTEYEKGVVTEVATNIYDKSGVLETVEIDLGDDGSVDDVSHVTIEVDGGIVTTTDELDEGNDGTIESVSRTVEDGKDLELWYDDDADGDPEFLVTLTYDEYGNLVYEEIEFYDAKTGDVWYRDETQLDELDEWNRVALVHEVVVYDGGGPYHMTGTYEYTCH